MAFIIGTTKHTRLLNTVGYESALSATKDIIRWIESGYYISFVENDMRVIECL